MKNFLTSNWETSEAPFLLKSLGLANSGVTADDNRVEDEAVLVTLHLADHVGLSIGRAVVVNNTQTTLESHVDGHLVLSDSVHGGGDEGSLERDALGDGRVEGDLRGREANVARQDKEVVVGQATVLGRVHKLLSVEAIARLVLSQHLQSGGVVEDLGGAVGGHFIYSGIFFFEN